MRINIGGLDLEAVRLDEVDSTNDYARRLAPTLSECGDGAVVFADYQSGGKGRLGRTWISPRGKSVMMSVLLWPKLAMPDKAVLTLIAACSVVRAIEPVCGADCAPLVKWPNDILAGGKKICGILAESGAAKGAARMELTASDERGKPSCGGFVIMGIGVNVNQGERDMPAELARSATSLKLACGAQDDFDREQLADGILRAFIEDCLLFSALARSGKDAGFALGSPLYEYYVARCVNIGKELSVARGDERYSAVGRGITPEGYLIVELENGKRRALSSGETSMRGMCGYAG
jgi:BirA family biotin operon repressor/biotin-[acetyl-CoA-carboxylase] ligase